MDFIKKNIDDIKEQIKKTSKKIGEDANKVTLVAITKTIPYKIMIETNKLGINDLGENKVQELCKKHPEVEKENSKVKWHFVGHLQTNKVKNIIDKVDLIHSVDSYKLALEIDKRAKQINKIMDILVQVNLAKEESKFGISIEECDDLINLISKLQNIKVTGLMTIAPYSNNPEDSRKYFRKLKKLSIDIEAKNYDNVYMNNLSMGMSGDFVVAIEEGANIIRIGTALFGKR